MLLKQVVRQYLSKYVTYEEKYKEDPTNWKVQTMLSDIDRYKL